MKIPDTRKLKQPIQHLIAVAIVVMISAGCFVSAEVIGYRVVSLILLMTVSLLAMLFEILPVLIAAVLSAIIWNFFFIPPLYTFHIDHAEDILMFLLYFLIALINAVLTFKVREIEKIARDKEEKENTIKLYNTLLNSLSHELRTPISTIIGAVDTLKENKDKLTQANESDLLSQIGTAGMRLNRQVENLLNMSRLESGMLKMNLDWCDLNELIFSVLQKLQTTNHKHKITFIPDDLLPLYKIDAGLMEQVIHNIIINALQYTPENSAIAIVAKHESDSCTITISDGGKGFPDNEMPLVFDKFYRLPCTQSGGSGLGLSIAKGITEAHDGKIILENMKEGGAKFTITIPAETSFIKNLKND